MCSLTRNVDDVVMFLHKLLHEPETKPYAVIMYRYLHCSGGAQVLLSFTTAADAMIGLYTDAGLTRSVDVDMCSA